MRLAAVIDETSPKELASGRSEEASRAARSGDRERGASSGDLLAQLRDEEERLRRIQILSVPTEENLRKISDQFGTEAPRMVFLDKSSARRMSGLDVYFVRKSQGSDERIEAEAALIRKHVPIWRGVDTTTVKDIYGEEYHAVIGVDAKTANGIVAMNREKQRATRHKAELLDQLAGKGNHEPDKPSTIDPSKLADTVKALGGDAARQTPEGVTAPTAGLPKPQPSRER